MVALSLTNPPMAHMSHGSENPLSRRAATAPSASTLPRLHLASNSPRRRELLTTAGILHDAAHPGLDDGQLCPGAAGADPERWVMALAYLKAASALRAPGAIAAPFVLGADTIVVHNGRAFGQPSSAADARHMLLAMRDAEHDVLTGVALISTRTGQRDLFSDRAVVTVGHITDDQINSYVASCEWKGKAGAYNLSERLAAGWPITFTGDSGTIMGLPVAKLIDHLRAFAARTL